ncbi:MAG: Gfo/Idh/MocA family protein, partial [Anaerolineae bacterium]
MEKVRFAFVGFRHGHILSLYDLARSREDIEIVAVCEEDAATRAQLAAAGKVQVTHSSYQDVLDQVPCDVVAVGDYFGKRGSRAIEALRHGKHVVSDKPICTSLAELDEIERLAAAKNLSVGCQLDMRDGGTILEARRRLLAGEIGSVHTIVATGQHPLLYGQRPGWYFEPGKHGGTINDIAVHATDAIPWMTDLPFAQLEAARAWNARLPQEPIFQDAAQFMATLSNGCGVLCDV